MSQRADRAHDPGSIPSLCLPSLVFPSRQRDNKSIVRVRTSDLLTQNKNPQFLNSGRLLGLKREIQGPAESTETSQLLMPYQSKSSGRDGRKQVDQSRRASWRCELLEHSCWTTVSTILFSSASGRIGFKSSWDYMSQGDWAVRIPHPPISLRIEQKFGSRRVSALNVPR